MNFYQIYRCVDKYAQKAEEASNTLDKLKEDLEKVEEETKLPEEKIIMPESKQPNFDYNSSDSFNIEIGPAEIEKPEFEVEIGPAKIEKPSECQIDFGEAVIEKQ